MREAAGDETSTRHYHVRLTKGNEEGQEDEKNKVKEDELNMCTTARRIGGRKRKRKRRGRGKQKHCSGRSTVFHS